MTKSISAVLVLMSAFVASAHAGSALKYLEFTSNNGAVPPPAHRSLACKIQETGVTTRKSVGGNAPQVKGPTPVAYTAKIANWGAVESHVDSALGGKVEIVQNPPAGGGIQQWLAHLSVRQGNPVAPPSYFAFPLLTKTASGLVLSRNTAPAAAELAEFISANCDSQ